MFCEKNSAPFCADAERAYKPLVGVEPFTFGPNVTGTIQPIPNGNSGADDGATGVFSNGAVKTASGVNGIFNGGTGTYRTATFNSSNSNSTYTDNGKVYPASIALNFIIKT